MGLTVDATPAGVGDGCLGACSSPRPTGVSNTDQREVKGLAQLGGFTVEHHPGDEHWHLAFSPCTPHSGATASAAPS